MSLRLLWALCLVACGTSAPSTAPPDASDAEAEVVDAAPDVPTLSGWEAFQATLGTMETIAGLGQIRDKGVNGWQPVFEGAAATAAELSRPHIALADDAGRIFIADKDAHAIRRVDADGSIHTVAGTGVAGDPGDEPVVATDAPLSAPNGLWVQPDGSFYILDLGNDRVRAVDTGGEMTTLFEIGGAGTGRGLWMAPDGAEAWVAAGSRVVGWSETGGVVTVVDGFSSLGNLAPDRDGVLTVTDRGADRVYRVLADGSLEPVAGNGTASGGGDGSPALETGLDGVRGLWFPPEGGMLLATHEGEQLWFVDDDGILHLVLDADEPRAVTMTPSGDLLLTESDYGFVRRIPRL